MESKRSGARVRFSEQKLTAAEQREKDLESQKVQRSKIEQEKSYLQKVFFDFYDYQKEILSYKLEDRGDEIQKKYQAKTIFSFLQYHLQKQQFEAQEIAEIFLQKAENGKNLLESFVDNVRGIVALENSLEAELARDRSYKANEKFVDQDGETKSRRSFFDIYPLLKQNLHNQIGRDVEEVAKVAGKYLNENQMQKINEWKKSIFTKLDSAKPQPQPRQPQPQQKNSTICTIS